MSIIIKHAVCPTLATKRSLINSPSDNALQFFAIFLWKITIQLCCFLFWRGFFFYKNLIVKLVLFIMQLHCKCIFLYQQHSPVTHLCRGLTQEFEITEELATMHSVKGTRVTALFRSDGKLSDFWNESKIKWLKWILKLVLLHCITTQVLCEC